jgi:hypothetical protein
MGIFWKSAVASLSIYILILELCCPFPFAVVQLVIVLNSDIKLIMILI